MKRFETNNVIVSPRKVVVSNSWEYIYWQRSKKEDYSWLIM